MKKLVALAPKTASLCEYTDAEIQPNEVKVHVEFAAPKHGTEIADFRATTPFIDEKFDDDLKVFVKRQEDEQKGIIFGDLPLGNMWVGTIVEKGANVTDYNIGDRVCSYGSIRQTHIVNAVDNYRLRKLSKTVSAKNAVCYDPAQYALAGIRDANIRIGDSVVIIGLGAIGQIAVQLAKNAGASIVIGVDPIKCRRDVASEYGADYVFSPETVDIGLEVKRVTNKMGADAIIETSGSPYALQDALKGLAYAGTISYVAFAKEFKGGLCLGREAHFNYGKIVFSRAGSEPNPDYPRWSRKRIEDTVWDMLTNGQLDCEKIVYPVVPFSKSAEGYSKYLDTSPQESIKLGINFGEV